MIAAPEREVPTPGENPYRASEIALWRVEGEESGESSGGPVVFYVLTEGGLRLPNPGVALDAITGGRHALSHLHSVEYVAGHVIEYVDDAYDRGCANQWSLSMTPDAAALVASLLRELKSVGDELRDARCELSQLKGIRSAFENLARSF